MAKRRKKNNPPPKSRRRAGAALAFVVLVAALGLGVGTKISPSYDTVFGGDEVQLLGADSYYHLRHARVVAHHWPTIMRWDVGTHFPSGHRSRNAGTFDWIAGTVAKIAADAPAADDNTIASVLAWLPPVFTAVVLLAVFGIGRRLGGALLGATMAAICAVYPGEMASKLLLGFADHHAIEVALLALLAWTLFQAAAAESNRARRRWSVGLGVLLSMYMMSWAGAPLIVAATAIAMVGVWIINILAGRVPDATAKLMAISFATFTLTLAFVFVAVGNPALLPGMGVPTILGGAAVSVAAALSPRLSRWLVTGTERRRWLSLGILVAPLLVAGLTAMVFDGVRHGLDLLLAQKLSTVAEHRGLSAGAYLSRFGALLVLAPLGVAASLHDGFRGRHGGATLAVGVLATIVIAVHMKSGDYGYLASPMLAVLSGVALAWGWHHRCHGAHGKRIASATIVGLVVVAVAPAAGWTEQPWIQSKHLDAYVYFDEPWREVTAWLRDQTPQPTMDLDTPVPGFSDSRCGFDYPDGTYGVMVPWSFGNFVSSRGRRPVYWSQGASAFVARWFLHTDENQAAADLATHCDPAEKVRDAVLDARTLGPQAGALLDQSGIGAVSKPVRRRLIVGKRRIRLHTYGKEFHDSLAARLFLSDEDKHGRFRQVYATPSRHLVGYRIYKNKTMSRINRAAEPVPPHEFEKYTRIAASKLPQRTPFGFVYDSYFGPSIKVFEVVAGARLRGAAPEGTVVEARLELERPDGSRFVYRRRQTVGKSGRFSIRVSQPTEKDTYSGIKPIGQYSIVGAHAAPIAEEIAVPIDAVHDGLKIAVPTPTLDSTDDAQRSPREVGAADDNVGAPARPRGDGDSTAAP